MTEETTSGYRQSPFDFSAFAVEDAKAAFRELQESGPFRESDSVVVLTRMADILEATKRRDIRSGSHGGGETNEPALGNERPLIPLQIDGPEHTKYRKLLDPLFAPRVVAALEPHVVEVADELIDQFVDQHEIDFYRAFCVPLPSRIFLELMGLPHDKLADFLEFKDAAIRPKGDSPAEQTAYQREVIGRMNAYLNAEFDRRLESGDPGDDLIGGFLTVEVDGDRLTREDILDIVFLLLIAGLDTVSSSLSLMVSYLAKHPEQRQRLVDDPSLLPTAIEEMLRTETPVPMGGRFATQDFEVDGKQVKAGDMVAVFWAAANVDPDVFEDPLRVDFERPSNRHITFAAGFHRCLGSHLARMELRAALATWHRRVPEYSIPPGKEPVYNNDGVRIVDPLPLLITPA
ncbi:MAG TPA: cytochrome P450 [Acidimicrobiia bacterium]|jgi:cytochrome P450